MTDKAERQRQSAEAYARQKAAEHEAAEYARTSAYRAHEVLDAVRESMNEIRLSHSKDDIFGVLAEAIRKVASVVDGSIEK